MSPSGFKKETHSCLFTYWTLGSGYHYFLQTLQKFYWRNKLPLEWFSFSAPKHGIDSQYFDLI